MVFSAFLVSQETIEENEINNFSNKNPSQTNLLTEILEILMEAMEQVLSEYQLRRIVPFWRFWQIQNLIQKQTQDR